MASVAKERPVDFTVIPNRGIHPFYLEMKLDEVLMAMVGWRVYSIKADEGTCGLTIKVAKKSKTIEIYVRVKPDIVSDFVGVVHIDTYHAIFENRKKLNEISNEDIENYFNTKLTEAGNNIYYKNTKIEHFHDADGSVFLIRNYNSNDFISLSMRY